MADTLTAVRMTRRYRPFLDRVYPGSKIVNYAEKATGRPCDICGHVPEDRPPKPGYPDVSEEMRLMRVRLPAGVTATDASAGRTDFTVTGELIELNVCRFVSDCRERAAKLMNSDGTPRYESHLLDKFR